MLDSRYVCLLSSVNSVLRGRDAWVSVCSFRALWTLDTWSNGWCYSQPFDAMITVDSPLLHVANEELWEGVDLLLHAVLLISCISQYTKQKKDWFPYFDLITDFIGVKFRKALVFAYLSISEYSTAWDFTKNGHQNCQSSNIIVLRHTCICICLKYINSHCKAG